jgi:hypothetical protein
VKENYNTNQNQKSAGVGAQVSALPERQLRATKRQPTSRVDVTGGVVIIAQMEWVVFQVWLVKFFSLSSELVVCGIQESPLAIIVEHMCSTEQRGSPELVRPLFRWLVSTILERV